MQGVGVRPMNSLSARAVHTSEAQQACQSQAHMRAVLLSFPGWLCLFCAPGGFESTASAISSTNRASTSHGSGTTQEEMASTALDFREMMRKERERAMKQRTTTTSASKARCALGDRSHATMWSELLQRS